MKMKINKNLLFGISIILILALSRLLPHPPNFTPILAMGFFAGAVLDKKIFAYIITLSAMILSDLFIGFHSSIFVVYFALSICVLFGTFIQNKLNILNGVIGISGGVLSFYLITNFAVWYGSGMYTLDFNGLITCYIMALPFLQNTILSSAIYGIAAFGAYRLAEKYINFRPKSA